MPHLLPLDAATLSRTAHFWPIALPVLLGSAAVYLLLPRPRNYPTLWGAAAGAASLLLAGWLLIHGGGFNPETILFYAFSGIAITSGVLLITQRNPALAALSFALVVLSTCGLFLLQAAPFLMAATIIIYAGAIIVTFLFVLMLAQQEGLSDADYRSREPLLATVAGFVLLGSLLYVLSQLYVLSLITDTPGLEDSLNRMTHAAGKNTVAEIESTLGDGFFDTLLRQAQSATGSTARSNLQDQVTNLKLSHWPDWKDQEDVPEMHKALKELRQMTTRVRDSIGGMQPAGGDSEADFTVPPPTSWENVAPLGRALFSDYLLAVELAGTLLFVATIGAIAIANRRGEGLR